MKINSLIKKKNTSTGISTEFPLKILQLPSELFFDHASTTACTDNSIAESMRNRSSPPNPSAVQKFRNQLRISSSKFNCPLENMDEPWQITGIISTCVLVRVTSLETRGRCVNTIKDAYVLLFGLFIFASSRLSLFASTPFFLSSFPIPSPGVDTKFSPFFFFFFPFFFTHWNKILRR